jgi:hypothetical protein
MTAILQFLLTFVVGSAWFIPQPEIEELDLIAIHQLIGYPRTFDLSGVVDVKGNVWIVNDNPGKNYAYKIELQPSQFQVTDSIQIGDLTNPDIEGLDYCPETGILYTDEMHNKVYSTILKEVFDKDLVKISEGWGTNKGLEGIAVDCDKMILYLAKEREPRLIISYNLETKQLIGVGFEDSKGDISDLKFENGFLYVLERNDNLVAKLDANSMKVISKVSYKNTCSHQEGKLYSNSKYGMAEALLLTPDEIWIGLDNNGLPFSDHAQKTYGLTGNSPVIIRFKRPAGF